MGGERAGGVFPRKNDFGFFYVRGVSREDATATAATTAASSLLGVSLSVSSLSYGDLGDFLSRLPPRLPLHPLSLSLSSRGQISRGVDHGTHCGALL